MTLSAAAIRCCPQTGRRRIAILGATGSIGTSALDVIRSLPDKLEAFGLSACKSVEQLEQLAAEWKPRVVAIPTALSGRGLGTPRPLPDVQSPETSQGSRSTETPATVLTGPTAIEDLARHPDVDLVLSAIVGAAGLRGSWAALEAGKPLALANKETLVVGGSLVMTLAERNRCPLLPVDSEHSAIFQIIGDRGVGEVERVVLTASGGPFRGQSRRQLQNVTVEQALQHPTWKMGRKITVDSATLMNKALEIVEARWLFGLAPEQIRVVIHPESVVHSFVEFRDGSVLAQLSPPDMRLPIQYALTYPERLCGPAKRLDWLGLNALTFEQPDHETFGAIALGFEVARRGGTAGAALNAANEAAVARFLAGSLTFLDITPACREVVAGHPYNAEPTLDELFAVDRWARQEIERWQKAT
jgi:1-deoxy-D-xylulose-5-phosphate reductoisomerase